MSELLLWLARERISLVLAEEELAPSIRPVTEHLHGLSGELNRLQNLLKGNKIHQHTDNAREIEGRVRRIEYLVYDMEDIIEKSRRRRRRRRRRSRSEKCVLFQDIIKTIFTKFNLKKIRSEIELHSEQIRKAVKTMSLPEPFGMEKDKGQVLDRVLSSEIPESSSSSKSGFVVIPIFGVIGSGKTTLAKEIFEDETVTHSFEKRIWINVSNKFKTDDILQQINGQSGDKTSLIVLDDIRSTEAWKTLRLTLPRGKKGSKILVTTREQSVAEYISEKQDFHKTRPLNDEESWELFTKVFSRRYLEYLAEANLAKANLAEATMAKMTKLREMVKSCKGVPQLIKELAYFLAPKQAEEWEIVYKNIQAYVDAFFCTVYSELLDYLKPCFLHLGQFSEDQQIDTEKLFQFWMIEGFLSTRRVRGERMMDQTERYLEELSRNKIIELQEEAVPTRKKFKAYKIVREIENLCVSWGEQNHFLKIVDLRKNNCSLSSGILPPRLVVYLGNHIPNVAHEVVENVRSLRVVGGNKKHQEEERICPIEMLKFKYFRVLRILDFDGIDCEGQQLPGAISDLVLLRYLSLKGCILKELPSSIGKLVHLQVLDLRVNESTEMIVADVLRKMRKLKHLYLPLKFRTQRKGEKLRLDSLKELETLENFNTSVCKVNDVYKFPKLRYLAAKVEENSEDFKSITSYMRTTSNNCLCASINIIDMNCYAVEMHSVLQELLRCKVLQNLHFKGHIGHLPPYDEISPNFTQLVLNNSHLKKDPMPTLEKLPNLEVLVLSDDAYMGKKMVCSASGFRQLKHLGFMNLHLLEKFEVECTAMPVVSVLKITNCERYDRIIPDCLNDRSTNHHLKIIIS